MFNKRWICFSFILLILIISISVVSAQDNATQTIQENTTPLNEGKTFENVQTAIDSANENGTVELEGTYLSQGNVINISKSITLKSEKGAILDAGQKSTILNVTAGNVILKNINFFNSKSENDAAITSNGNLTIEDCYFKNNLMEFYGDEFSDFNFYGDYGGAIYSSNSLKINNSTFENNHANGYMSINEHYGEDADYITRNFDYGGAVGSTGNLFITDSTFIDSCITTNVADSTIVNSIFKNGHRLLDSKSKVAFIDCIFRENEGSLIEGSDLIINNCDFTNNCRNSNHDYALIVSSDIRILNSIFKDNGLIIIYNIFGGNVIVENSIFENTGGGPAIMSDDVEVINSTFVNNSGYYAGAIRGECIKITNCTFKNNMECAVICYKNITVGDKIQTGNKAFDNSLNQTKLVKISVKNTLISYNSGKCPQIKLTFIESKRPVKQYHFAYIILKGNKRLVVNQEDYCDYHVYGENEFGYSNGKCEIPNLSVGTYKIKFVEGPFETYNLPASITFKITKADTIIKAPKITAKFKKSKYFQVAVKHKTTKKPVKNTHVKIKIDKKTYNVKTNSKGMAKVNIKKLKVGKHKVTVTSGNSNYKMSAKSTITIKR